jgi:hypothetical protein
LKSTEGTPLWTPALPEQIAPWADSQQVPEKLNSANQCDPAEAGRRGHIKGFDFFMNGIASLRSQ